MNLAPKAPTTISVALVCALAAGCTSAPKPIKDTQWEKGAVSAQHAPPAPEVDSGQKGAVAAQAVRSRARKLAKKPSFGGGPDQPKPSTVAVADIPALDTLGEAPGPEASASEIARWLVTAWRQRRTAKWIQKQLDQSKPSRLEDTRMVWSAGDYDADDRPDLAVAFFADCAYADCSKDGQWTAGVVWGAGGWSELTRSRHEKPAFYGPADLTGDGRPELLLGVRKCGAHTCFVDTHVYSSHRRGRFRPILHRGPGSDSPPQSVEVVKRTDKPGALKLAGGQINSAGAGIFQRSWADFYGWDEQKEDLERQRREWEATDLRLHRLHDAILALERADLERAAMFLGEVIESDALREVPEALDAEASFAQKMRDQLAQTARNCRVSLL